MDEAERGLQELLLERLTADSDVPDRVAELVLAAWEGDLDAAMSGDRMASPEAEDRHEREPLPEVFIGAVHVEGFRGVGEPATLALRPGPGLTLVTGRNGSGKSSFAEAAELALTGTSGRWKGRTAVWRDGWRNLHRAGSASIAVDLVTSGHVGTTRIHRSWDVGDELDSGRWSRQRPRQKVEPFDGTEWGEDLNIYRPFLSYSELGALIGGRPSDLHDALHALLGLEPLNAAQDRLRDTGKRLTDESKAVGKARKTLRAELALGTDEDADQVTTLRRIVDLQVPDDATVAAALLRAALHHHDSRGDGPAPSAAMARSTPHGAPERGNAPPPRPARHGVGGAAPRALSRRAAAQRRPSEPLPPRRPGHRRDT